MHHKLINYVGIDYKKENCKWIKNYTIKDSFKFDESIYDLLSFSVFKKDFSHKIIDFFEGSNFLGETYFSNLLILKNFFDINVEYSTKSNLSKISMKSFNLNNASIFSLEDFNNSNLDIKVFISDLFSNLENENTINFSINVTFLINEL